MSMFIMSCLPCLSGVHVVNAVFDLHGWMLFFFTFALCIIFYVMFYLPTFNAHTVSVSLFNYSSDAFRHLSTQSSGSS
jgi:hypothetical protein